MTIKKFAVMAALTAALGFAGATSAMAADEPSDSCTISSDGVESCADTTDVNPVDETNSDPSVDPSSGCWTTEDGTDVCAKGYFDFVSLNGDVVNDEPAPTDEPITPAVCTDDNGAEITCPEVMMYSNMPGTMEDVKRDISLTSSSSNSSANLIPASAVIATLSLSLAGALYAKKLKK
jgi:hypothetical protein